MFFIPEINRIAISIGPLNVYWYGLSYFFGIIIALFLANNLEKKYHIFEISDNNSKISKEIFDKFFLYLTIFLVLGGRIGYVVFYNPIYYFQNPQEILMTWNGGMAFHGALIGMVLYIYIFTKIYKLSFLRITDLICFISMPGIFLGRIGNFINRELLGKFSDLPWSVFFSGDTISRHPSQIYEALFEGLIPFLIIFFLNQKFSFFEKKNEPGFITIFFLFFYGISRFIIEMFFRIPDELLGYILLGKFTMGQLFCFIMIFVGILIFKKKYDRTL